MLADAPPKYWLVRILTSTNIIVVAILHDQINFTKTATVVFFQQNQILLLEKGDSALLGDTAFVFCG